MRRRHRRRHKPARVTVPTYRWWHLVLAVTVALVAVGMAILLLGEHRSLLP